MGPLETEEVLRQEAAAIHQTDSLSRKGGRDLYVALNRLGSSALCLSGGGIRSAAFALGAIQALATHPRAKSSEKNEAFGSPVDKPEESLLSQFHYLSTVSGGGYIGSWLSAWRSRSDFGTIWKNLIKRPLGTDLEPIPIGWLRSYSNYLTPRTGIVSADSWAAAALAIGNLTVNWCLILPFISAGVLSLKLLVWLLIWGTLLEEYGSLDLGSLNIVFALLGVLCLLEALIFIIRNRPSRQPEKPHPAAPGQKGVTQAAFLKGYLVYTIFSAIALTQFLGSNYVGGPLVMRCTDAETLVEACSESNIDAATMNRPLISIAGLVIIGAGVAMLVYAAAWIWANQIDKNFRPKSTIQNKRERLKERFSFASLKAVLDEPTKWCLSGMVYGALVGFGFYLYLLVPDEETVPLKEINWFIRNPVMYLMVGVPWLLLSQFLSEAVFAALTSYRAQASVDWEWLARAGGWKLVTAVAWMAATLLIFPNFQQAQLVRQLSWIIAVGGISALAIVFVVVSRASPGPGGARNAVARLANVALTIASPLFGAALIFCLSIGLDKLLFGASGTELLNSGFPTLVTVDDHVTWLWQVAVILVALIVSIILGFYASRRVNINRFSLHSVYRDRLVRAFLGASRERERDPDRFTDMDPNDNPRMHALWSDSDKGGWRPFHLVNTTLNIVSAKRLAWQERKAASFTVSPLHCGTAAKTTKKTQDGIQIDIPTGAFRYSWEYGGWSKERARSGISLGTAMAISGAAASPNMGYHFSPAVTFLMAMLNVRLGWWLGNPAAEGEKTYTLEGPVTAINALFQETFGLTTDDAEYVYLSDGGHFENLGLYEVIRRRCRYVVVIDAGCDRGFAFEDLGNALRKVKIDLGISIDFKHLQDLRARSDIPVTANYHAIGEIDYRSADGGENGIILYVKPAYQSTERPEIQAYAKANGDFPHQSTTHQNFGETHFESYRALGFDIMDGLLNKSLPAENCQRSPTLQDVLQTLRAAAALQPA
jgi:hypothetical protein